MKSTDLMSRCDNLTHRKLDYWCHNGIFTDTQTGNRRNQHRTFTEEDLQVALVLARVSAAFDAWSNGRGGFVAIYREIARQVRAGAATVEIVLAPGIKLDVVVVDQQPTSQPPPPEPEPEPAPEPAAVDFIPGVGAENA